MRLSLTKPLSLELPELPKAQRSGAIPRRAMAGRRGWRGLEAERQRGEGSSANNGDRVEQMFKVRHQYETFSLLSSDLSIPLVSPNTRYKYRYLC